MLCTHINIAYVTCTEKTLLCVEDSLESTTLKTDSLLIHLISVHTTCEAESFIWYAACTWGSLITKASNKVMQHMQYIMGWYVPWMSISGNLFMKQWLMIVPYLIEAFLQCKLSKPHTGCQKLNHRYCVIPAAIYVFSSMNIKHGARVF